MRKHRVQKKINEQLVREEQQKKVAKLRLKRLKKKQRDELHHKYNSETRQVLNATDPTTPLKYKVRVRKTVSRISQTVTKKIPQSPKYAQAVRRRLLKKFTKDTKGLATKCEDKADVDQERGDLFVCLLKMQRHKLRKQFDKFAMEMERFKSCGRSLASLSTFLCVPLKMLRTLCGTKKEAGGFMCNVKHSQGLPSWKYRGNVTQKEKVVLEKFFQREDVTNELPHRKYQGKRFMRMTLAEAYRLYCKEQEAAGERTLSTTSFQRHKPWYLRLLNKMPDLGCQCDTCLNCDLKAQSLIAGGIKGIKKRLTPNILATLCSNEDSNPNEAQIIDFREECINRNCAYCGVHRLHEAIEESNPDINWEKEISYHKWETKVVRCSVKRSKLKPGVVSETFSRSRVQRSLIQTSVGELLNLYLTDLKQMSQHQFNYRFQAQQFEQCKNSLEVGDLLIVCDFATNFKHYFDKEPQKCHFARGQTTVHPIVCMFKCNESVCKSLVTDEVLVASDDLDHDCTAVDAFEQRAVDHLKEDGIDVKRIFRFSDNCAGQYKSRHVFDLLSQKKIPYNSNNFCSKHGKGPSDGVAGRCMQHLTRCRKAGKCKEVRNAETMVQFLEKSLGTPDQTENMCQHYRRHFFCVNNIEVIPKNEIARCVKFTQKIHSVRNTGVVGYLEVRFHSCFCSVCKNGDDGECTSISHVHPFTRVNIHGQKQKHSSATFANTLWSNNCVDLSKKWKTSAPTKRQKELLKVKKPATAVKKHRKLKKEDYKQWRDEIRQRVTAQRLSRKRRKLMHKGGTSHISNREENNSHDMNLMSAFDDIPEMNDVAVQPETMAEVRQSQKIQQRVAQGIHGLTPYICRSKLRIEFEQQMELVREKKHELKLKDQLRKLQETLKQQTPNVFSTDDEFPLIYEVPLSTLAAQTKETEAHILREKEHEKALLKQLQELHETQEKQTPREVEVLTTPQPLSKWSDTFTAQEITMAFEDWNALLSNFGNSRDFTQLCEKVCDVQGIIGDVPKHFCDFKMDGDKQDDTAKDLMPVPDAERDQFFPIYTTPNGDCLPNAISRLVYGHERSASEIRCRMVVEATRNWQDYVRDTFLREGATHLPAQDIRDYYTKYSGFVMSTQSTPLSTNEMYKKAFERDVLEMCRPSSNCGLWALHTAANAIGRAIRSWFPSASVPGFEEDRAFVHRLFACTSRNTENREPVVIMWTLSQPGSLAFNHFVPVVR